MQYLGDNLLGNIGPALSVDHMLHVITSCSFVIIIISRLGFKDGYLFISVPIPGHDSLFGKQTSPFLYLKIILRKVKRHAETDKTFKPVHEKTNNLGFRPGLTQTGLYSHRKELEA